MCLLFSEICIRSWNAFKGNSPWNQGPLWRKMAFTLSRGEASSWAPSLDTLEQGAPLWGWFPRLQPLKNIKERPMVYLGASMYFFWCSVYVVGGGGWGWSDGVYMTKGTSFLSFHPGNLYRPPTLSFLSWILPAYILLFVCFCFLFFLVVACNVFMSVLPVTYSDFHPGGCYQSEFSTETETASFNWGTASAVLDKSHNPRDSAQEQVFPPSLWWPLLSPFHPWWLCP